MEPAQWLDHTSATAFERFAASIEAVLTTWRDKGGDGTLAKAAPAQLLSACRRRRPTPRAAAHLPGPVPRSLQTCPEYWPSMISSKALTAGPLSSSGCRRSCSTACLSAPRPTL